MAPVVHLLAALLLQPEPRGCLTRARVREVTRLHSHHAIARQEADEEPGVVPGLVRGTDNLTLAAALEPVALIWRVPVQLASVLEARAGVVDPLARSEAAHQRWWRSMADLVQEKRGLPLTLLTEMRVRHD